MAYDAETPPLAGFVALKCGKCGEPVYVTIEHDPGPGFEYNESAPQCPFHQYSTYPLYRADQGGE